jgi:transcriptional regulator with XRE-family HTH domain
MLSNNFKYLRSKSGLTQASFGEQHKLTRSAVDNYERAVAKPSHKIILSVAKRYGYSMEDLINKDLKKVKAGALEISIKSTHKKQADRDELVNELRSEIEWLRKNNDRLSELLEVMARSVMQAG